jgi:hypothetical protein|tara:strand:+ start:2803 stop:3315 length:513 start_codon:yes stop_codon:yes gene_type:complete
MEENVKNNVEENVEQSTEQVRSPREVQDREVEQRVESWENPSNLPNPTPQPGWVFRWIRTSLLGNSDNPNVSKKFREGWQPCRSEDHPELQIHMMDYKSEWADKGNVEIGGQLLCKMPKEKAEARDAHFRKLASNQIDSVDNVYFKDQDSRMATKQVFERKSRTTFGKDS